MDAVFPAGDDGTLRRAVGVTLADQLRLASLHRRSDFRAKPDGSQRGAVATGQLTIEPVCPVAADLPVQAISRDKRQIALPGAGRVERRGAVLKIRRDAPAVGVIPFDDPGAPQRLESATDLHQCIPPRRTGRPAEMDVRTPPSQHHTHPQGGFALWPDCLVIGSPKVDRPVGHLCVVRADVVRPTSHAPVADQPNSQPCRCGCASACTI
jgi:hypothetical protein